MLQFGRCVARGLASSPGIDQLGIYIQVDPPELAPLMARLVQVYAHPALNLEVRAFGGSRWDLAAAVSWACYGRAYDRVMYLLVNQAVIAALPRHLPYEVWEVGRELFKPLPYWQRHVLRRADRLLSISHNTAQVAARYNRGLPASRVVHLCVEPPLFEPEPEQDPVAAEPYNPARRALSVLIVGNIFKDLLYKGHKQLISAWPRVVEVCPQAELWIAGDGTGRPELEAQVNALPPPVARQIIFLGSLSASELDRRYRQCRVFAMPSTSEGFGLVFIEAARYGVPCIGGKDDSVKEIVLHKQTGLLVAQDPEDIAAAALQLLTQDDLAEKLGRAGQTRYQQHFRFPHFRDRLLTALELQK